MKSPSPPPARPFYGFTLLEVMVVIVVLGVLGMLALPSFRDAVLRSRRADAVAALTAVQQAQERWRSNGTRYTTSLTDLRLAAASPGGHYAISISAAGVKTYRATAEAQGRQADDSTCATLVMELKDDADGMRTVLQALDGAGATVTDAARRCWKQ